MKTILAVALALLCSAALATNKPPVPDPHAASTANAAANASAGATSNALAAPSTSSANGGDYSVIALPGAGAAAPLPAGMCLVGESSNVGGLSFFSAKSRTWIDMECLKMLVELERLKATPLPRPTVEILTRAPDSADSAIRQPAKSAERQLTCAPPAKAKTVAAAKKAGACTS